jgi:catechol 2,3-dioxygenase-like lactoylglutathione lyase family enzyme
MTDHKLGPNKPTWTHLALHVNDIVKTTEWYKEFTHLTVLFKEEDDLSYAVWLFDKTQLENPFVLVLTQFFEGHDPFAPAKHPVLGPFAHIGIEVSSKEAVDDIAAKGKEGNCLIVGPQQMSKRIGYICFLKDPEGNTVEFSSDQGVYDKVRELFS